MHDGFRENGWLEFCGNGVLRTSLCADGGGIWELRSDGEMCVTFGECHHIIALLPENSGQATMFELIQRLMRNGAPLNVKRKTPSRRRLDTTV